MSGSKSHKNAFKANTPSSLKENLQRKLEIIREIGNFPHNHARNSVVKRNRVPYYEPVGGHSHYDGSNAMYTYLMKGDEYAEWAKPTKRVKIPPIPSRTQGIVGPEIDWSVRARNMPIVFIKQMAHVGTLTKVNGRAIFQEYFDILFSNREFVHPKHRPKIGCSPTFNWTDHQVKTWTMLANSLGVKYAGKTDYSFPKACLGYSGKGNYGSRPNQPWPTTRVVNGEEFIPLYRIPKRGRKRSELSRIKRSLAKVNKFEVGYLDFKNVLTRRRVLSRKRINFLYSQTDRSQPISEFRDSIPYCLSVSIGPPMQVSDIVKRSLRKLCSRVCKIEPSESWVPDKAPVVHRRLTAPITHRKMGRLMASYCGDGRYYITHSNTDNRVNIRNDHDPEKVIATLDEINDFIGNASSDEEVYAQYGYSGLGDW
jgi:hypothetical protein